MYTQDKRTYKSLGNALHFNTFKAMHLISSSVIEFELTIGFEKYI